MAKQEVKKEVVKKAGALKPRKKIQRSVPSGIAHVKATFNNTLAAITDPSGNVIS